MCLNVEWRGRVDRDVASVAAMWHAFNEIEKPPRNMFVAFANMEKFSSKYLTFYQLTVYMH